jgi:hypothetical protein
MRRFRSKITGAARAPPQSSNYCFKLYYERSFVNSTLGCLSPQAVANSFVFALISKPRPFIIEVRPQLTRKP